MKRVGLIFVIVSLFFLSLSASARSTESAAIFQGPVVPSGDISTGNEAKPKWMVPWELGRKLAREGDFHDAVKVYSLLLVREQNIDEALPNANTFSKVFYLTVLTATHLFYYTVLICIMLGIYSLIRYKQLNDGTILILLFSFFSILMIMITVGTPRYKYPILMILLPIAAHYIEMKIKPEKQTIG